jgi:hypothetical protein
MEIDHARRFVSVTADGRVVLQDVLDYFDRLVVDGGMPYPKLFDATGAKPQFSDDDMMVLGARASAYAEMEPRGPLALVGTTEEVTSLLRRFMNLGRGQRPVMLFGNTRNAREWLATFKDGE